MKVLVIILSAALIAAVCRIIADKVWIKRLARRISEIRDMDTNTLLHADAEGMRGLVNEINEVLRQLRAQRMEYVRKKHTLDQMLTNISHDLRTPLTSAMGYIGLIDRAGLDEETLAQTEIISQRLERLEELINSFFEFSKMISQDKEPEKIPVDIVGTVEGAVAHYYDDYSAQGREIAFVHRDRRIMLPSNRSMLMRIFDNLISNALKHGEGTLTITAFSDTENVTLEFENGLHDEEIDPERVFDEFYTTDISRRGGSTGLGLAIAKQFVSMLGGNISAECFDGRFLIRIELPTQAAAQ